MKRAIGRPKDEYSDATDFARKHSADSVLTYQLPLYKGHLWNLENAPKLPGESGRIYLYSCDEKKARSISEATVFTKKDWESDQWIYMGHYHIKEVRRSYNTEWHLVPEEVRSNLRKRLY
jgi:hypothetical protein